MNTISVDVQDGWTVGLGNTATVDTYITNAGGGTASVPEPSILLLLGTGLVGIRFWTRMRLGRRQEKLSVLKVRAKFERTLPRLSES
jgi:hypothetical protein